MLKVSFARFGQPEGAAHTVLEAAPGLAPPRGGLVPLGGNVQLTRGELCDTGEVELSFAPPLVRPLDWCRVWGPGKAGCAYLGYVLTPPVQVERDRFTVKLGNLKDILKKLRWMGDLEADGKTMKVLEKPFKDFIQAVYARILWPAGVTAGPIADPIVAHTTARSNTRAELLGDTLDALVNAVAGGAWGVNAQGQLCVVGITDEVRDRYPLGLAELGSPQLGDYVNAVEVPWDKPNGDSTFFAYADGDAVADTGGVSVWASETLPTRITATQTDPYAGEVLTVTAVNTHPQAGTFQIIQSASHPVFQPDWAGKLVDGLNLGRGVLYGATLPVTAVGDEQQVLTPTGTAGMFGVAIDTEPPTELRVLVSQGRQTAEVTHAGGVAPPDPLPDESAVNWMASNGPVTVRYHEGDLSSYLQTHDAAPGLGVRVTAQTGTTVRVGLQVASAAFPNVRARYTLDAITDTEKPPVPAPFGALNQLRITFVVTRLWTSGDVIETGPEVTGVTILAITAGQADAAVALVRVADTDTGRRVWAVPRDVWAGELLIAGDVEQSGRLNTRISDKAALAAYASELLRYRMKPLMAFTYTHPTLAYLPPLGQAAFQLPDGTDSLQDAQRTILDFSAARTRVEYGAPIPGDHDDPIMTQVRAIGQDIRALRGGT